MTIWRRCPECKEHMPSQAFGGGRKFKTCARCRCGLPPLSSVGFTPEPPPSCPPEALRRLKAQTDAVRPYFPGEEDA